MVPKHQGAALAVVEVCSYLPRPSHPPWYVYQNSDSYNYRVDSFVIWYRELFEYDRTMPFYCAGNGWRPFRLCTVICFETCAKQRCCGMIQRFGNYLQTAWCVWNYALVAMADCTLSVIIIIAYANAIQTSMTMVSYDIWTIIVNPPVKEWHHTEMFWGLWKKVSPADVSSSLVSLMKGRSTV